MTDIPEVPESFPPWEHYTTRARSLFQRHPKNPILLPEDMPIPCKSVCNPGAILVDGEILLLLRVIAPDDRSHLFVARSKNGIDEWRVEPKPLLSPDDPAVGWYDTLACEDPRLTRLEDTGEYVITYVGVSRYGAGVCLATTRDFKTVTRLGLAIHPYNKDAALFPRKINGKYQLLHRPTAGPLEDIWISESDDLKYWGNPRCVLEESDQPGWDNGKVGAGPTPVETLDGWGLIFHGVQRLENSWLYRFGMVLLDKDDPSTIIARWPDWVFSPEAPYEFDVKGQGIVFPTGLVQLNDSIYVYYGAGDSSVALAVADRMMLREFRAEARKALASRSK